MDKIVKNILNKFCWIFSRLIHELSHYSVPGLIDVMGQTPISGRAVISPLVKQA